MCHDYRSRGNWASHQQQHGGKKVWKVNLFLVKLFIHRAAAITALALGFFLCVMSPVERVCCRCRRPIKPQVHLVLQTVMPGSSAAAAAACRTWSCRPATTDRITNSSQNMLPTIKQSFRRRCDDEMLVYSFCRGPPAKVS